MPRLDRRDAPGRAARGRGALRRPPGVRRGRPHRSPSPSCSTAVRDDRRGYVALGLEPGDRVVRLGAEQHRRGSSPRSPCRTPAARWCRSTPATPATRSPTSSTAPGARSSSSPTGSSAAPRSPTCAAASDAGVGARASSTSPSLATGRRRLGDDVARDEVEARADAVAPDDVADILFTSGTTGRPQGRDERAPADDRRRRRVGRARRGRRRRPLPGGQPVLPLLRLQGRHRRRPAHRRHALPGGDVRRRRDDAR